MATHITLEENTAALLARLASATGLTTGAIINRLVNGHLPELHELDAFLEMHPSGSPLHDAATNLLLSYGPESIVDSIQRIAPGYVTLGQRFKQELAEFRPKRGSTAKRL